MLGLLLGNACAFSRSWNEFTFILVLLKSPWNHPLTPRVCSLSGGARRYPQSGHFLNNNKVLINKNECEFIPRSRECTSITKQLTKHYQAIAKFIHSISSNHSVPLSIHSVMSISPIHLVNFIHSVHLFCPSIPIVHLSTHLFHGSFHLSIF